MIDKIYKRGCVKTLAQPLLYFTDLLYFLLSMLLFSGQSEHPVGMLNLHC